MHHEALTKSGATIFPKLKQFSDFYLAGGTALALQIDHRISVDFDLLCPENISKDLLATVERVFSESTEEIVPLVNNPDELSVLVNGIKITFLRYPFPVLNKFVDLDGVKSLDIVELSATKAYAIGRRGSFKDYVDLFLIISGGYTDLDAVISLANKKYGGEFNSRLFLEQLHLDL